MKKFCHIIMLILITVNCYPQSSLKVYNTDFDLLKTKAKDENKAILLFVTSNKCGACDRMKSNILSDSNVINFFNTNFLFFEFNIHTASEKLKERLDAYNKKGWPRIYFMDSKENIKYLQTGCGFEKNADEYLEMWNQYELLDELWKKTSKSVKNGPIAYQDLHTFIMIGKTNSEYAYKFNYQFGGRNKAVDRFFEYLPIDQYHKIKYWNLYKYASLESPQFQYLLNNQELYCKNIGKEKVQNLIFNIYYSNLYRAFNPIKRRNKVSQQEPYLSSEEGKAALLYFDLEHIPLDTNLNSSFIKLDSLYKYRSSIHLDFINNWSWEVYKNSDDFVLLNKAYNWSSYLIKQERNLYYLDTHAKLALKCGKQKEAEIIETEILEVKKGNKSIVYCTEGICK